MKPVSLCVVFAAACLLPMNAGAAPMECTEDYLRMALGNQGTMPSELLRACLRVDPDDPEYGVTQYMISIHFRRLRRVRSASVFLARAARTPPLSSDARVLYLLAQYQIAAGDLEEGLVAKDRFLANSGALSRRERMRRTRNLYALLEKVYEIRAAAAAADDEQESFARVQTNHRFYREARMHLDRDLGREGGGVVRGVEEPLTGPQGLPRLDAPSVFTAPEPLADGPRSDPRSG